MLGNKMKKNRVIATTLTLSLLALTLTLTINANATQYINVNWGHMLNPDPYSDEYQAEAAACSIITSFMSNKAGWSSSNYYNTYSTSGNLYSQIWYRQQNDVWAHDFWVGDFYPTSEYGAIHYNFYGENGYDVHDKNVYTWTASPYSKQRFTFIWTCACGNVIINPSTQNYCYGYFDNSNNAVGMALAWTHRTDLNLDGYGSPDSSNYCYLGWNSTSLGISVYTGNPLYHDYEHFIYYFYQHLANGYSINDSLDYAANVIWSCGWHGANCRLGYGTFFQNEWHWINVFGKGSMSIP